MKLLVNEIKNLQETDHKNIVKMIDCEVEIVSFTYLSETRQCRYLVLEFTPQGDLCSLLMKLGDISDKILLHFFSKVLEAIDYLHNKGIAHRNLCLQNFHLTDDFELKLTDFSYATSFKNSGGV